MGTRIGPLLWQVPLTVLAGVAGSLVIAWAVSRALGLALNPSVVAVMSGVLGSVAVAIELRGERKHWKR
jgi:hypothetical protein